MTWYDQTAEQRERERLPQYIARPPRPDFSGLEGIKFSNARYAWDHSWELHYDIPRGGWGKLVREGWEVREVNASRRMDFVTPYESPRREEIERWADGFINGSGTPGLVWPEDRDAVLREVARRLREATADGFLLRSLVGVASREEHRG